MWDEMFKKKFVIERRTRSANVQGSVPSTGSPALANRRYKDSQPPVGRSETVSEPLVASSSSMLEATGIRN
jgi:hypothetical protein